MSDDMIGFRNTQQVSDLQRKADDLQGKADSLERRASALEHELRPYAPTIIVSEGKKIGILGFTMGKGGSAAFTLSVVSTTKFSVGAGSITDGTNGAVAFSIGSAGEEKSGSGFVVISADVDASLECSNWALEVSGSAPQEVVMTESVQTKVNLLIGKVGNVKGGLEVAQAISSSQRVTHGLMNGVAVRVFESAPTHPDNL